MKVAVTGAGGFIGRHVLRELSKRGLQVLAVSRSGSNNDGFAQTGQIVELDIYNPLPAGMDILASADALIHLAWGGLPNYGSHHHFELELPRHYAFLKSVVERGLRSCLVAGTCLEYGMQSGALSEDAPTMPTTAYGIAKDALRRQLELLRETQPFSLTWARIFYLFGEGQPETSLYSQFIAAVRRNDSTFDMSGGEQLRDYMPVTDLAKMLVDRSVAQSNTGPINLCSGKPISVRRLVEEWRRDLGADIELNLGRFPYPDYEPMAFWGDRRKLDSIDDTTQR
jgi:nucleoside-diphosphate-sugar epimerase